jgi:hypothetical protein
VQYTVCHVKDVKEGVPVSYEQDILYPFDVISNYVKDGVGHLYHSYRQVKLHPFDVVSNHAKAVVETPTSVI